MENRGVTRVGVLGAGGHSVATHGPALREIAARWQRKMEREPTHPVLELAAICDLDSKKAECYAETFGFRTVYTSLDVMVSTESLDVLFLITPLSLTEEIVAKALPLDIPLLIEKPPGINPEATRRLLDIARAVKTPHMVSFNRRFNPALRRAMEWIQEKPRERSPTTVIARMLRHNRCEPDFAVGTGIHLIDALIALMGVPRRVHPLHAPLDQTCRFFNAQIEFTGGASANILIAPACGYHQETIEAHGEDFSFEIDLFANRFRVFRKRKTVEEWTLPESDHSGLADVLAETEHLLASLDQEVIHPNLEDGLISMLTSACIQSGTPMTDMGG